MKLLGFVGSLRKGSYNRALYQEFVRRLPQGAQMEEATFSDWPLYNKDIEDAGTPQVVLDLKQKIAAADGILIVTPEYNRSIPGGLKNMIDWTSRGDLPWKHKKVYVMGVSSGDRGTIVAQYDLKRILTYFDCRVLGQPEFYLNGTGKFDDNGKLLDEKTAGYVDAAVKTFVEFI